MIFRRNRAKIERRSLPVLPGPLGNQLDVRRRWFSPRYVAIFLWVSVFGLFAALAVQLGAIWNTHYFSGSFWNDSHHRDDGGFLALLIIASFLLLALLGLALSNRLNVIRQRSRFVEFETLVASIGHDLRTPLQTIHSAILLLAGNLSVAERAQCAAMAKNAVGSLSRLVTDITQIASGEPLTVELANINIEKWFNDFVERYKEKVHAKKLQFKVAIDPHPMILNLDPDRLTQCIGNLMDNAIRYTQAGQIELSLKIRNQARGSTQKALVIKVKDTGSGIAKADLSRIFLPFERATDSKERHGMGLGLSIVQTMARGSGGSVHVKSELGVGSTFTFVMPVQEVACISVPWEDDVVALTTSRSGGSEILIVDEDPSVCASIGTVLLDAGYSVQTSHSSTEALDLITSHNYKLILLNTEMSGATGYEIAETSRKLSPTPCIIALIEDAKEFHSDSRANLFDGTLLRSCTTEDILNAVEKATTHQPL